MKKHNIIMCLSIGMLACGLVNKSFAVDDFKFTEEDRKLLMKFAAEFDTDDKVNQLLHEASQSGHHIMLVFLVLQENQQAKEQLWAAARRGEKWAIHHVIHLAEYEHYDDAFSLLQELTKQGNLQVLEHMFHLVMKGRRDALHTLIDADEHFMKLPLIYRNFYYVAIAYENKDIAVRFLRHFYRDLDIKKHKEFCKDDKKALDLLNALEDEINFIDIMSMGIEDLKEQANKSNIKAVDRLFLMAISNNDDNIWEYLFELADREDSISNHLEQKILLLIRGGKFEFYETLRKHLLDRYHHYTIASVLEKLAMDPSNREAFQLLMSAAAKHNKDVPIFAALATLAINGNREALECFDVCGYRIVLNKSIERIARRIVASSRGIIISDLERIINFANTSNDTYAITVLRQKLSAQLLEYIKIILLQPENRNSDELIAFADALTSSDVLNSINSEQSNDAELFKLNMNYDNNTISNVITLVNNATVNKGLRLSLLSNNQLAVELSMQH